jgi:hypothetical protein
MNKKSESEASGPGAEAPPGAAAFGRMAQEQADRASSIAEQIARFERQSVERMKAAVQDAARLYTDTLEYAAALSAHWRHLTVDATLRAADALAR